MNISGDEIARRILAIENWRDFQGFGPIPGIERAEFEVQTAEVVGSRIRVFNADGSSHLEEITAWEPDRRLSLHMHGFSPPLARLANGFDENWEFEPAGSKTKVTRSFQLHARNACTWPLLWLISLFLRKAIARHLRHMHDNAASRSK